MHIHVRIHRWVLWWFYVGVACGAVALVNILGRDLSRAQDRVIVLMGAVFWGLGGLACYGCGGIEFHEPDHPHRIPIPAAPDDRQEWHPASDFRLPGSGKTFLPPRH